MRLLRCRLPVFPVAIKKRQTNPLYVHLNYDNRHPPAIEIIIEEADEKPEDCKLSMVFEDALTLKSWLVDLRLRKNLVIS